MKVLIVRLAQENVVSFPSAQISSYACKGAGWEVDADLFS